MLVSVKCKTDHPKHVYCEPVAVADGGSRLMMNHHLTHYFEATAGRLTQLNYSLVSIYYYQIDLLSYDESAPCLIFLSQPMMNHDSRVNNTHLQLRMIIGGLKQFYI